MLMGTTREEEGAPQAPGASIGAGDPLVARARSVAPDERAALSAFVADAARGALIGNWRGRWMDEAGREDVRQEVHLRILAGVADLERPIENLADWVRGTVDLVLRERWRDRTNRGADGLEAAESVEAGGELDSPPATLLHAEDRELVRACLETLPPHHREMLRLKFEDGRTNRATAEQLGKTEKAVERALPRALGLVRECLGRKRFLP